MTQRRIVLMVDAGFLLKALVLQAGQENRASVAFDYAAISEALADSVQDETGTRPVRQIWYDAARDGRPRAEHRALADRPGVQVRLGWIVVLKDGGPRQKAVDSLIVRDLIRTAYCASADEVVLLAGDGDLAPGVQEASEYGIFVHIWGIASEDKRLKQSDELVALADTRLNLDIADLAPFVRAKQRTVEAARRSAGSQPTDEFAAETMPSVGLEHEQSTPHLEPNGVALGDVVVDSNVTETDLEGADDVLESAVALPPSLSVGAPSLRQLLTTEEYQSFRLGDQTDDVDAGETGHRYGRRWLDRVDGETIERFIHQYARARLPRRMDLDVIEAMKDRQIDVDEQANREAARNGFWDTVETVTRT